MSFLKPLLLLLLLFMPAAYGIEDVVLDLKDIETIDTTKTSYLFEETLTKHFDNSPIESMHFFAYYRAALDMDINSDDNDLKYDYSSINAGINGNFRNEKNAYMLRLRFNPVHDCTFMQYLLSDVYISNSSVPNNTFMIGNSRTATGYEGAKSLTTLPFYGRAQISRNFGNVRKLGARVKGDYSYLEYDLGAYTSDVYFTSFFSGTEFAGWANFKPFGDKNKEKLGVLKLGGGITAGKKHEDYFVSGAYAGYERNKFSADFEWAKADGYNGNKGIITNKAEGFYTTLGYKLTPKIQLVARYDQFKPNLDKHLVKREYSTGINYFIKGQALKLMLNYIFCQNNLTKDSHKILLGTQILL